MAKSNHIRIFIWPHMFVVDIVEVRFVREQSFCCVPRVFVDCCTTYLKGIGKIIPVQAVEALRYARG
jgi:hypothetical protein